MRRIELLGSKVDNSSLEQVLRISKLSRLSCLSMIHKSRAAHLGSSLSVIDILSVIFGYSAKVDKTFPDHISSDQVLISKGHAAAGSYAVLAHAGFFDTEILDTYCEDGSLLSGHVTYGKVPGVPFSTGSLGHGLPLGIGLAYARKEEKNPPMVYVIMSDGECDEGTTWESALIANHLELHNLVVVIDRNHLQSFGSTESTIKLEPFARKWDSFGWNVYELNGHDHKAIADTIELIKTNLNGKPSVLICETTKGKGVSFMENQVIWHYRPPTDEQFIAAKHELESK